MRHVIVLACALATTAISGAIHGAAELTTTPVTASRAGSGDAELAELRMLLNQVKADYDARIRELEDRLLAAEQGTATARRAAADAVEIAEDSAIAATVGQTGANVFNPAIGAVLVGRYTSVEDGWEELPGFPGAEELGPGGSGFGLGESEINFKAAIDSNFFGNLTLALEDEDGDTNVAVEEAWVQTLSLPHGFTALAGRYFSRIGYLNSFHRHADDFSDRPLPYQAFFGGQYIEDGARLSWVAPTSLFFELGAETNWGDRYPNTGGGNSPGGWDVFAKFGGDIGYSHSWQLGLSYIDLDVKERGGEEDEAATFTGSSNITGVDFVYKWAPNGNPVVHNLKLQGEYFYRDEDGSYGADNYDGDQQGWYLQGVWQFLPRWRVGYRYDELDIDNDAIFDGTPLADPGYKPRRDTFMIDWASSEYSRLRLQYSYDQVNDDGENQLVLQYIMSLGAHGAHAF